jgi:type III pantothenate kinase
MTARIVADVGNSRIKWGLVNSAGVSVAALPPDDPATWTEQLRRWQVEPTAEWAIASVHPVRRNQLAEWLRQRGDTVRVISDYRELPLRIDVSAPERVGIDRLLNAVAALARATRGAPVVIIDAGSAVTVDLVDPDGIFRGGAIFPGLRLMARGLHDHTAQLPLVEQFDNHEPPGADTEHAIRAGIHFAVCGAIDRLVERMLGNVAARVAIVGDNVALKPARVLFAGGDTNLAADLRCRPEVVGPALTLEGIRRVAWPDS